MSRKGSPSFSQLYQYMNANTNMGDIFAWNLPHCNQQNKLLQQFYKNSEHLRHSKHRIVLYHEIVSLRSFSDVPLELQMKALQDLCSKYLQARGKDLLGYGRIHLEQGHIHMHLMLSSNEMLQRKRHRLEKEQFRKIQKDCERYLLQTYPSLKQEPVYTKGREITQKMTPSQELEKKKSPEPNKKPRYRGKLEAYYERVKRDLEQGHDLEH